MSRWAELWRGRTVPRKPGSSVLATLMEADGLDSGFAGVPEAAWRAGVRRLADRFALAPGASVFEVGCGAGAFLYDFAERGHPVGGIDLSPALVACAAQVMPGGAFTVGEAAETSPRPRFDAVVSLGVFIYFSSDRHAERVLDRMAAKARGLVAVLDVPDLATRDACEAYRVRVAGGHEAYAERYAGLEHRYYDREWMADALRARGLVDVQVETQAIERYGNAPFRFNAWGRFPEPPRDVSPPSR